MDSCPSDVLPAFGVGYVDHCVDDFAARFVISTSEIGLPQTESVRFTLRILRLNSFEEGNKRLRDLLGGSAANLAEMTNIGLPVPPGFTIITDTCNEYYAEGEQFPTVV